ncbi:MAG: hypothetical protein RLN78_05225 [Phycisphaerales bacterium]
MQSQSHANTQQDTPQLTESLLEDLLNPAMTPILICQIHGLTLPQLRDLTHSTDYQSAIEAIQSINAARQPVIESQTHLQSLAALKSAADLAEQDANYESLRKSATTLLRETRPTPRRRPRRPIRPTNSGCHGLSSSQAVSSSPKIQPITPQPQVWHAVCDTSPAGIWCSRRNTDAPTEARHELRHPNLSIRSTHLHPPTRRDVREPRKPWDRRV